MGSSLFKSFENKMNFQKLKEIAAKQDVEKENKFSIKKVP